MQSSAPPYMSSLRGAALSRDSHRGLLLLARLAGNAPALELLTAAPVGTDGFAWLMHRRIDALLDDNPLQPLYNRIWMRQRDALVEVMTALARRDINALCFKGAEIHLRHFADHALGGMGDVDILVPREKSEGARAELHELGYRHGAFDSRTGMVSWFSRDEIARLEVGHYELAPLLRMERFEASQTEAALLAKRIRAPICPGGNVAEWCLGINIDVHTGVATNISSDELFKCTDPGSCGAGRSMPSSDLLWFTASRYYSEVGTVGKRSLRDLAYIIALLRDRIDWDHVMRVATDNQLGASLFYPLAFLQRTFGAAVPEAVLEATSPLKTPRRRDWGWQLGVLFDFIEPLPL
jgi:hypothetical protein